MRLFGLIFIFGMLAGCRTFNPPKGSENPQPWAQPEKWQESQGIPGFSSSTKGGADY